MKDLIKEFKEFAMKGSVIDLAVGVIIGGAFGKIITSIVTDIISPIIGVLIGGINFSDLSVTIGSAKFLYGDFLQNTIDFLIVAFVLFLFIKVINKLKRKEVKKEAVAEAVVVSKEEKLLTEIRDLLAKKI